jgi:hypothetical protein
MDELICGVNKALIEKFLILIRENYRKADKATFFLELRAGVSNVPGIANSRDVLSHLATALDPNLSDEERQEQLIFTVVTVFYPSVGETIRKFLGLP